MKENLNSMLCSMLDALDECAARALNDGTRAEIAAQEIRLGQIVSRAQLILSFLDAHKPPRKPLRSVK